MTNRLAGAMLGLVAAAGVAAASSSSVEAPVAAGATNAPAALRAIFVSVPPAFETLKRAPVLFPHDRHTRALTAEGCAACHPRKDGTFAFDFPIERHARGRDALMNAYHDACIGCHDQRADAGRKSGPVTCGECHDDDKAFGARAYLPTLPQEVDALKDPYHKQCATCHLRPEAETKKAEALDWKRFYVRTQPRIEQAIPAVVYDYAIHDKHQKTLEKRCELCHYLSPERKQKLEAEGKQPTGQDWLREVPRGESWKDKDAAHRRCLNCHLRRREEKKPAGPVACGECHTGRPRPLSELAAVPPIDYGDKARILIRAEKARMAGVPFDHKAHIAASRSCGDCHHDTLESCGTCHRERGVKEGGFITLAEAYHAPTSTWSCVGCHAREARKPDCAGCHRLRDRDMTADACAKCHTGKLESLDQAAKLPDPASLFPSDLKDQLEIATLENEFEKVKVEHKKIAAKLTEISNNSKLATFFHAEPTTLCAGCHHQAPVEKGKPVPGCATCHTARNEPVGRAPALLGAYHQACLGCHRDMAYPEKVMPRQCEGCHKKKTWRE